LGEGSKYVALYSKPLAKLLGCSPYLGTLNVSIDHRYAEALRKELEKPIVIDPPRPGLGRVYALKCSVMGIPCLAVFPEKSVYGLRAIEIVSCVRLRTALALEDGDCVCIEIER